MDLDLESFSDGGSMDEIRRIGGLLIAKGSEAGDVLHAKSWTQPCMAARAPPDDDSIFPAKVYGTQYSEPTNWKLLVLEDIPLYYF